MKVVIILALVAMVAGRALDDCAVCKQVVTAIDAQLKSNSTVTEIEDTVNKICDAIPGIADECKQYVKQYVPEIIAMITAKITPSGICDELKLCNNSFMTQMAGGLLDIPMGPGPVILSPQEDVPLLQTVNSPDAGEFCVICEFALRELEKEISNNSTEAQIIAAVEKVCDILPSTVKAECKQLIESEGTEIINMLINKADPKTVCTLIKLCTAATKKVSSVGDKPYCQICEQVMTYVQSLLKENATLTEIEAVVDKVCDYLPGTLQDQCKQLVDAEAPKIIAQLAAKVNPDQVCASIDLCVTQARKVPTNRVV